MAQYYLKVFLIRNNIMKITSEIIDQHGISPNEYKKIVEEISAKLLTNIVIEDYKINLD